MTRAELIIKGRVQGVFYRASAQREGQRLGLSGEVSNEDDGSVRAAVEGPKERVEEFIAWCRRGPPSAQVDEVQVRWTEPLGQLRGFRVTR
jgi:acylphosphatase